MKKLIIYSAGVITSMDKQTFQINCKIFKLKIWCRVIVTTVWWSLCIWKDCIVSGMTCTGSRANLASSARWASKTAWSCTWVRECNTAAWSTLCRCRRTGCRTWSAGDCSRAAAGVRRSWARWAHGWSWLWRTRGRWAAGSCTTAWWGWRGNRTVGVTTSGGRGVQGRRCKVTVMVMVMCDRRN